MNIDVYFDERIKNVNVKMKEILSGPNKTLTSMSNWLLQERGKQLRPKFMIAASAYFDKQRDVSEYAAMVELIHVATLVHDDVIDNSDFRRGRLSVHKKYGLKSAVYLGDYIIFSMVKNMTSNPSVDGEKAHEIRNVIMESITKLCDGEMGQNDWLFNISITKDVYLRNIEGKTAALFELSAKLGAILNDAEDDVIDKFGDIGRFYGILFQMSDDLLDMFSTKDLIGKPVFQDFCNGIYTLPIILSVKTPAYKDKIINIKNNVKNKMSSAQKDQLLEIMRDTGSLSETFDIAKEFYDSGIKILSALEKNDSTEYFESKFNEVYGKICEFANNFS